MILFLLRCLFQMAAELEAHGREQFVLEIRFTARTEALVKGGGQHGYWNTFVDCRLDRPSPLT